jgi:hypothetical protein
MTDDQDNPGINVPPPLIYVVPLLLGLLLDRRRHISFLPRGAARALGWPLLGGGVMLNGWFLSPRIGRRGYERLNFRELALHPLG